mmetsp:Transcript_3513/g.4998  ORF Transcript_3513/g.4998 Transcript_3513/m.4998 type:complete len:84 (-) Transcript_3513:259-510(-)
MHDPVFLECCCPINYSLRLYQQGNSVTKAIGSIDYDLSSFYNLVYMLKISSDSICNSSQSIVDKCHSYYKTLLLTKTTFVTTF